MYLLFVSSLNENVKLAEKLQNQLSKLGEKSEIINLVELNLPMYTSAYEDTFGIPENVNEIVSKMKDAKGYIFISPEYNFSLPPIHVNFIAWVSRVGDDFRFLFTLKYVQVATHSGGNAIDVVNAMRVQFTRLGSIVMPRDILTTYEKQLNEESSEKILTDFINSSKGV